jgi:hypothetical protein
VSWEEEWATLTVKLYINWLGNVGLAFPPDVQDVTSRCVVFEGTTVDGDVW